MMSLDSPVGGSSLQPHNNNNNVISSSPSDVVAAASSNARTIEIQNNLKLASEDTNFVGLQNLFDDDEESEDTVNRNTNNDNNEVVLLEPFQPIGMKNYNVKFGDKVSLNLLQASTAFGSTGDDDTGLVLWGASIILSRFLVHQVSSTNNYETTTPSTDNHDDDNNTNNAVPVIDLKDKIIMELGCGNAVPSLTIAQLGISKHVIATDFRKTTLQHVQYHIEQNEINRPYISTSTSTTGTSTSMEVLHLDWEDHDDDIVQVDVIIAADVIYGVSKVPALVNTINKYLKDDGNVIIATRDGRRGIDEFLFLMENNNNNNASSWNKSNNFELIYVKNFAYHDENDEANNKTNDEILSSCFQDEISMSRWKANHTIYVFRRQQNEEVCEF